MSTRTGTTKAQHPTGSTIFVGPCGSAHLIKSGGSRMVEQIFEIDEKGNY